MAFVEAGRLAHEEGRHGPQGLEPADRVLAADGVFHLVDERDETHGDLSGTLRAAAEGGSARSLAGLRK